MITRRAVLAAGAGVLVAGPSVARAQVADDAALLRRALRLEQLSLAGYAAAAAGDVLPGDVAALAAAIVAHERQHADVVAVQLEALGGSRPADPADVAAADAVAQELALEPLTGALESRTKFLEWAEALELRTVAVYLDAARRALDVGLIQTVLSILAAEGQHLAAVRAAAGREPISGAFESGG